jgi:hypothetical protein
MTSAWAAWLDEQARKTGYTAAQIAVARALGFLGEPIADEHDGSFCLTWRYGARTITVDIGPAGEQEWWTASLGV